MNLPADFPQFTHHPDPIATGAVAASDVTCACCEKKRAFAYTRSPYCVAVDLDGAICPWCIADGSAAKKYDATFVQGIEHVSTGRHNLLLRVKQASINEVLTRTPGYVSWQGETWLSHCADAMEYHGDLTSEDLLTLSESARILFTKENEWLVPEVYSWQELVDSCQPGESLALYKFVCRHCSLARLGLDMD